FAEFDIEVIASLQINQPFCVVFIAATLITHDGYRALRSYFRKPHELPSGNRLFAVLDTELRKFFKCLDGFIYGPSLVCINTQRNFTSHAFANCPDSFNIRLAILPEFDLNSRIAFIHDLLGVDRHLRRFPNAYRVICSDWFIILSPKKGIEWQTRVLCSNIMQSNVECAFYACISINQPIHRIYAVFNIQRVSSHEKLCEILSHHKAGINAFAINAHEGTTFSVSDDAGVCTNDDDKILGIVYWAEGNHKRLLERNEEFVEFNLGDGNFL